MKCPGKAKKMLVVKWCLDAMLKAPVAKGHNNGGGASEKELAAAMVLAQRAH